MRLLPATRRSVNARLNSGLLHPSTSTPVNQCLPLRLTRLSLRPSITSFRRTFALSGRSFQKPTPRTPSDQGGEEKTQPSTSGQPQTVRTERICTIPNILTLSRILACPVLGHAILHDNFYVATGLLVYAGLTDLVRVKYCYVQPEPANLFRLLMGLG